MVVGLDRENREVISLGMDASLTPLMNTHGTMVEEEELGSMSSSSANNSSVSSDFIMDNDATSSITSSSSLSNKDIDPFEDGPLYEMSSLAVQLPFKRGLSNFYDGKSQSFASLSDVRSSEDLAKPDQRPCRKKLKPCKSYGGSLDSQKSSVSPEACSKTAAKKASRGPSSFSASARTRRRTRTRRPPIPPQRSRKFSLLFA